jgi:hypothetical protein
VRARLTAASGVDVPLRLLFDHPTLAALATAVHGLSARPQPVRPQPVGPRRSVAPASAADLLADFES